MERYCDIILKKLDKYDVITLDQIYYELYRYKLNKTTLLKDFIYIMRNIDKSKIIIEKRIP